MTVLGHYLICPLGHNGLDVILEHGVNLFAVGLPDLPLLLIDVGGSLGKWEQSPSLDVTLDLVDRRGQLVHLSLNVWQNYS